MTIDTSQTTTFDPEAFMSQTVDQPFATDFQKCPEGEYQAMIDDFDSKAFGQAEWTDSKTGEPRSSPTFDCPFVILDEAVKAELGRDKLTVPYRMFIDMKNGSLDWDKDRNIHLGRIRRAVGQNAPGPWSFPQLRGAGPVMVRVKHIADRKDPTVKRAQVVAATKIS